MPAARLISLWNEADREQAKAAEAAVGKINQQRAEAINALVSRVLEQELQAAPEELRQPLRDARDTPPAKRSEEQIELLRTYPRVLVTSGNVSLYDAKAYNQISSEFAKRIAGAEPKRPRSPERSPLPIFYGAVIPTSLPKRSSLGS